MEMQDLLLIPLGLAVGTFGTLVGAGGGFLLVPVLLFLYPDKKPEVITSISLVVVFANSVSGSIAYARQKRIDYRSGLAFAAGGLPGAVAGAIVVSYVPRRLFDAIFAALLISIGTYLLIRRTTTAIRDPVTGRGVVFRKIRDRDGNSFIYSFQLWKGVVIAAVVGFVSSLLGIGGGVMHVPLMVEVLHFPVHIATSTSQFVLAFMSGQGNLTKIVTGDLEWNRDLARAGYLSIGAIGGAQAGAFLARKIQGGVIVRVLAISLLVVGLRLGLKAL